MATPVLPSSSIPPAPPSQALPKGAGATSDFGTGLSSVQGASEDAVQRSKQVARWRRRTLIVRFWRGFLPVVIGAMVVGLIGWVGVKTMQGWSKASVAGGDIRMVHPQFYGRNAKNQPYTLTADEAVRDNANTQLVALVQPRLSMKTEAPTLVKAQSDRGLLNETTHILLMNGSVKVEDGRGYIYQSDTARINTETHDAGADSHVVGDGPMGHFEADNYRIDQKNGHAVLTGHVRTHLLTQGGQSGAQASPKTP